MPICKHEDFLIKTNQHKNLLGIDHGSKLIGIAISNKELFIATPLTTIVRKKQNVDFIFLTGAKSGAAFRSQLVQV